VGVGYGHGAGGEDGCLWIYDTDDEQTVAFTPDGIEYLREMLPEYKRNRSPHGLKRMVTFNAQDRPRRR